MSDSTSSRPVSLFAVVGIFVLLAVGLFVAHHFYAPAAVTPQDAAAENLTKDLQWRATAEARRTALTELKDGQQQELQSYAWIDQKAGTVRLPIERAMELTAQKYGQKQ
jgi:hypothetical protein